MGRRVLILIFCCCVLGLVEAAPRKPKKFDPMPVFITERSGATRPGQLMGQNAFEMKESDPVLHFDNESGTSEILVDNLLSITDIREDKGKKAGGLLTMKDGSQTRFTFGFCQENLWLLNPDGTKDRIDLRKIRSLEVLGRPAH